MGELLELRDRPRWGRRQLAAREIPEVLPYEILDSARLEIAHDRDHGVRWHVVLLIEFTHLVESGPFDVLRIADRRVVVGVSRGPELFSEVLPCHAVGLVDVALSSLIEHYVALVVEFA